MSMTITVSESHSTVEHLCDENCPNSNPFVKAVAHLCELPLSPGFSSAVYIVYWCQLLSKIHNQV